MRELLDAIETLLDSADNTGCDGVSVVDRKALDNLECAYWNIEQGL